MSVTRIGVIVVASLLMVCASAFAQSRWAEPYRNGVKAFEAGHCGEAVPLLERAVAADPKAQANKVIEGVFRTDYFPYYYLALCYADMQQWDTAMQNLDKARATLTRPQQAKFAETETKIKSALNAPKVDPRKAAFDAAAAQADAALSGRQFDQAIGQFDQLRSAYPSDYASAGLAAKRDEAVRGYATQLYDQARALIQNGKFNDAKAKLQLADQTQRGQKPVSDALADIKRREDEYQRLKTAAQADQNARNYSSARDKLEQARGHHPERFAADNLAARLAEVTTLANRSNVTPPADPVADGQRLARTAKDFMAHGKYPEADAAYASALEADPKNQEAVAAVARAAKFKQLRDRGMQLSRAKNVSGAQQALAEARSVDPERFTREGLAATVDKLTPPPASGDPFKAALQEGLLALLSGRLRESIAILEPAAARRGSPAALHAYLGVAYETQALSTPKADDRKTLEDKASEQFRAAKAAQANFQLSGRVVSPAIINLYTAARP